MAKKQLGFMVTKHEGVGFKHKIVATEWPLLSLLALVSYKELFKLLLKVNFMLIWWLGLKWECVESKILNSTNANQLFCHKKSWKTSDLKIKSSKLHETCIFIQD